MKSEPDRLDFLIVLLPVILVGLLGFQTYEYIQMNRQRAGALPVSLEEPPDAARTQEPEPPEAAPQNGESAPAESGDAALVPDAQPEGAGADGDTVAADPAITEPPAGEPAPDAGEPAADADQTPDAVEPAAADAPEATEPAAADADQTPDAASPAAAELGAGTPVADMPPVLEQPAAAAAAPQELGSQPEPAQPAAQPAVAEPEPVPEQPVSPPEDVAGGDAQVMLQIRPNPAKVGELIAVDVVIRGASGVTGATFHLRYDQAALQINADPQSEMGPFLEGPEGGAQFNAMALPTGRVVVSIKAARGTEGRSGDGRLATFYFQVVAPGETRLELKTPGLQDLRNRPLPAVFSNATLIIGE